MARVPTAVSIVFRNQAIFRTITVGVLGKMRRGKTNFASVLAEHLLQRGWEVWYVRRRPGEPKEEFWARIHGVLSGGYGLPEAPLLLVLDDVSFLLHYNEELENDLAQIRHNLGTDDIIVVFIYHYLKAVPPFIRDADVRVLFSLSWTSIGQLYREGVFSYNALKSFLTEMRRFITDREYRENEYGDRYRPALVADDADEVLVKIPRASIDVRSYEYPRTMGGEERQDGKKAYYVEIVGDNVRMRDRGRYADLYIVLRQNGSRQEVRVAKLIPAN